MSEETLAAILGDAQAAQLTASKTSTVMARGYKPTGFILCHPETRERCFIEMSAVRWISNDESWWLMHESKSPLHANDMFRESVRRLLIPVLKRCADHPMRCDYSDDANIALTAFLAENKEINHDS